MQGALPAPTGRSLAGSSFFARYGLYAGTILAALIGLLLLPAGFHAIAQHDAQISDRVSLLASVWLVIGLVLSVYLVGARSAILNQMSDAIRARLVNLEHSNEANRMAQSSSGRSEADLPLAGATSAARLLDIVFLLVIQAIIRPPVVGVAKAFAPEAWVDGGYVVLVVLIALALLINLRGASRPLLDHLLWLGLDQAVPTAGFVSTSASETFTRLTATTTNATTSSGQPSALPGGPPMAPAAEPTIAAPGGLTPTMVEASAATALAPESMESTVAAPRPAAVEATIADAEPSSNETVVEKLRSSHANDTMSTTADETLPPEKIRQPGRSEGEG